MKVDVLVGEIGSTTTVVNAFAGMGTDHPRLAGQGYAPTSVLAGDVTEGLQKAIENLEKTLETKKLIWEHFFASSSAAGGLRMTVHGLVYDMTVRAAKEAALGAGANIHLITAGVLHQSDLRRLKEIQPNIIMIAGGVDYGERNTALDNAEKIARLNLGAPVIYAGNIQNHDDIREIFSHSPTRLYMGENVYPAIDSLHVQPARRIIQDVFEEHIIHAPGMEKIRKLVDGPIIPTPGAVMQASLLLKEELGDLITFDVGGATTDVHSVTGGSEKIRQIQLSPEPEAKRTVEGDLGVYINRRNVLDHSDIKRAALNCAMTEENLIKSVEGLSEIPKTDREKDLVGELTETALSTALHRHAGHLSDSFTAQGRKTIARGRDLTALSYAIGTGGALTRLRSGRKLLEKTFIQSDKKDLLPSKVPEILIDSSYIMASLGVLSRKFPDEAVKLLLSSLQREEC